MPTAMFNYNPKLTPQQNLEAMVNVLNYLLAHLNSRNVKRLDTNETVIQSADGTTILNGSQIVMMDLGKHVRRTEGLDKESGLYVDEWYDEDGNRTAYIDSDGKLCVVDGFFTGSITGSIMTGGTIRTAESGARIELTGNKLTTYNAAGQMHGPRIYPGDGDIVWCHNGVPVLSVGLAGSDGVTIQPLSGRPLIIYNPEFSGTIKNAGTYLEFDSDTKVLTLYDDASNPISSVTIN